MAEAQRAMDAKRFEEEKKALDILRQDEKNPYVLGTLAAAQMEQNRHNEAEATIKQALASDPSDPASLLMMGLLRTSRAIRRRAGFAEFVGQRHPDDYRAQYYLGKTGSRRACALRPKRRCAKPLACGQAGARRTSRWRRLTRRSNRRSRNWRNGIIKRRSRGVCAQPGIRAHAEREEVSGHPVELLARQGDVLARHALSLRQSVHELDIATRGRGFYEFTRRVEELVAESGLKTGSRRSTCNTLPRRSSFRRMPIRTCAATSKPF